MRNALKTAVLLALLGALFMGSAPCWAVPPGS